MASTTRPSPLAPKSFQRYEPPQPPPALRSRTTTSQSGEGDVFEKTADDDDDDEDDDGDGEDDSNADGNNDSDDGKDASDAAQDGTNSDARAAKSRSRLAKFDELPIELATLTDRFVDSLSAKVHSEPPTIDSISVLFQDFYVSAAASIAIHISALLSRLNRAPSPAKPSTTAGARARGAHTKYAKDGQQMLTPSEVTEKRKARRLLEYKRVLLEEAVERRVCEKVYDKIWRHKSTLDDVRDEKLRSKTATLALVGIGLKDLGIQLGDGDGDGDGDKATATLDHIQQSLAPARDGLARMNDERSPLGKLQHLQAAHKAIVDTLCTIHPSGSSADEILPTLIYTLITSPVQGINIISNLYFIQRFRAASKIDGEAAYCMTNLEAAIAFLENVDLASLRGEETPSGPGKGSQSGSQPDTPPVHAQAEPEPEPEPEPAVMLPLKPSPASRASTSPSPSATTATATGANAEPSAALARKALEATSKALPSARSQRTFSDLLQPITAAPAAARRTAEESIESISSTLDNSFKFLFSRLREKSADQSNAAVIVPKTLDEARQLVSRPLTPDEADAISDNGSLAERDENVATPTPTAPSPAASTAATKLSAAEDKILNLIGGRRRAASLRDGSGDSQRSSSTSTGAGKSTFFAASTVADTTTSTPTPTPTPPPPSASAGGSTPLDTVRNFSASINNPISQIGSAFGGALRSFGGGGGGGGGQRSSMLSLPSPLSTTGKPPDSTSLPTTATTTTTTTTPSILLRPPTAAQLPSIAAPAPIARFVALKSANDLTVGDLPALLHDYQRLARLLDNLRLMGLEEQEQEQEGEEGVVGAGAGEKS